MDTLRRLLSGLQSERSSVEERTHQLSQELVGSKLVPHSCSHRIPGCRTRFFWQSCVPGDPRHDPPNFHNRPLIINPWSPTSAPDFVEVRSNSPSGQKPTSPTRPRFRTSPLDSAIHSRAGEQVPLLSMPHEGVGSSSPSFKSVLLFHYRAGIMELQRTYPNPVVASDSHVILSELCKTLSCWITTRENPQKSKGNKSMHEDCENVSELVDLVKWDREL